MRPLHFPAAEEDVRALCAGDAVCVSGRVLTAREGALRQLAGADDAAFRAWAAGAALYHCSPVVTRAAGAASAEARHAASPDARFEEGWRVTAAGPSDSAPLEPWTAETVARYGLRAVIGLGGMGPGTGETLRRCGAVYLHATLDLAVTLARRVTAVRGVHLLDALGVAEAVWLLEVADFPATVTMDAHGVSLHVRPAQA